MQTEEAQVIRWNKENFRCFEPLKKKRLSCTSVWHVEKNTKFSFLCTVPKKRAFVHLPLACSPWRADHLRQNPSAAIRPRIHRGLHLAWCAAASRTCTVQ